LFVLVIKYWWW